MSVIGWKEFIPPGKLYIDITALPINVLVKMDLLFVKYLIRIHFLNYQMIR
jgi:hypothetical protein